MIQRLQSVYLLLTTLCSVLFLSGNMLKFNDNSGNILSITYKGLKRIGGGAAPEQLEKFLPILIILLLIALISIVDIFIYRKRKLQTRFTIGLFILTIILIIVLAGYSFFVIQNFDAEISWSIKMILPLLMLLFTYLAYRGIRKDEDLVKSYDRLR
ncbi:MAG: hypothetical protein A2Y71_15690 [Bacteroidetes bacterium RBG_13_42_15]|nr:MAG: hypothetical protein A2Y71_15690 [Bacteroidetes bacterium RBG_13_42_15]